MPTPFPFLPVATVAFALFGALLVLVGASQDELRRALGLDLAQAGLLASTAIVGIGVGVLAGGPLVDRFPRRVLFLLATATTGAALCLVGPGTSFEGLGALLLVAGVGAGLYETVLNASAIERYQARSVRTLSLMHSGATLGAMLTPLGVGWLLAQGDWTLAFRLVGIAHLALIVLAVGVPLGSPSRPTRHDTERPRILTAPMMCLLVAAFSYIGVEAAITAFAVPYASDALGLGADRGRAAISVFWLGLLLGRLFIALRAESGSARPAALAGAVAGIAIAAGVAFAWTWIEVMLGVVGFALGGVFPLLVSLGGRRAHATGAGVAIVAGLGSAGGFVAPWLTGVIGDFAGVTVAVGTLAVWCAVLVGSALLAERLR